MNHLDLHIDSMQVFRDTVAYISSVPTGVVATFTFERARMYCGELFIV